MSNTTERGAAVVEFALIVPVLLLLVFGITQFGRAYYLQTTISGAARESARVMALRNNQASAAAAARAAAQPLVLNQITITNCPAESSSQSDATTTVTIRYPMSFVSGLFGNAITLTGKGVMRCNG